MPTLLAPSSRSSAHAPIATRATNEHVPPPFERGTQDPTLSFVLLVGRDGESARTGISTG